MDEYAIYCCVGMAMVMAALINSMEKSGVFRHPKSRFEKFLARFFK